MFEEKDMFVEMLENIHEAYDCLMKNGKEMMPASICMIIQLLIDSGDYEAENLVNFISESVKAVNEEGALDF